MAWGSWSWSLFFPKFSTHSAHPAALPRSWTVTCHLEWSLICLHSFWKFALYLRNMLSRDLMPKVLRVLVPNHLDQWQCLSLSLSLSRLANSIFHLCLHGRPFIFWFVFWLLRALRAQVFTNELLSCLLHFFAGPQVFPAPPNDSSELRFRLFSSLLAAKRFNWMAWLWGAKPSHAGSHANPAHLHAFEIERRCRLQKSKKKGSHALEILKSS